MLSQGKSKLVTGVRKLSTSLRVCASHYDVLGVTPKSTQSDIKTAYYKLSKVYHPDKSTDEAAAIKFRAITEAYEVLGNVKLKKMYDKGLLVGRENTSRMTYQPEPEPTDPSLRFYKSRANRQSVPTMDGRTPIYDFDAWAKNHYSTLYEKSRYDKEYIRQRRVKLEESRIAHRQETVMLIMFIIGSLFIVLVIQGTTDYDVDKTNNSSNEQNENATRPV
ncbi:uncharacterized protein LOC142981390 [Anticarsia gemmatalis]|uniref:uncharacterized protein LOC142981390 n=1 Tax=Anticarsia gemmatalis TaxID=129554 RepID=UPI003F765EF3